LNVNLDLTANTSSLGVFTHEVVKFLDSIFVRSRSNIEQKGELGLEILADTLEEPTMGVDLTVVTLLDAEHEVDSATSEHILLNTEVPCRNLETMQDVGWNVTFFDLWVHDILHLLHLEIVVTIDIHKAFLKENLLIEESFVSSQSLKAVRYTLVSITNYHHKEVIFGELCLWINLQAIVVM